MKSELEWKNGKGEYTTSCVPRLVTVATCAPVRPNCPWVQRTAFVVPVEPDVKISKKRSSSTGVGLSVTAWPCEVLLGSRLNRSRRSDRSRARDPTRSSNPPELGGRGRHRTGRVRRQPCQLVTAVGRVDADDDGAGYRRCCAPEDVLRNIVQQNADMRGTSWIHSTCDTVPPDAAPRSAVVGRSTTGRQTRWPDGHRRPCSEAALPRWSPAAPGRRRSADEGDGASWRNRLRFSRRARERGPRWGSPGAPPRAR